MVGSKAQIIGPLAFRSLDFFCSWKAPFGRAVAGRGENVGQL